MLISVLGLVVLFALAFAGLPLGIAMLGVGAVGFAFFRGLEPGGGQRGLTGRRSPRVP